MGNVKGQKERREEGRHSYTHTHTCAHTHAHTERREKRKRTERKNVKWGGYRTTISWIVSEREGEGDRQVQKENVREGEKESERGWEREFKGHFGNLSSGTHYKKMSCQLALHSVGQLPQTFFAISNGSRLVSIFTLVLHLRVSRRMAKHSTLKANFLDSFK